MGRTLQKLEKGQYWLALLLPVSIALQAVPLPAIGSHSPRTYMVVIWAFVLVSGVAILLRERLTLSGLSMAAVLLLLASLVSYFANVWFWQIPQFDEFVAVFFQLLGVVLMLVFLSNVEGPLRYAVQIIRVWIATGVLVGVYAIYQAIARTFGLPFGYLEFLTHQRGGSYAFIEPFVRPSGPFQEPSYLGVYLAPPLLLIAVIVLFSDDTLFSEFLDEVAMYVLGTAVVISFSLGAHVSLLVATMAVLIRLLLGSGPPTMVDLQIRPTLQIMGVLLAVIMVFQLLGIPFVQGLVFRIASIFNPLGGVDLPIGNSLKPRMAMIATGVKVWTHYPLFGVGLGNLNFYMAEFKTIPFETGVPFSRFESSGSAPIGVLLGTGVLGFLAFVAVYGYAFRFLVGLSIDTGNVKAVIPFGLFAVLMFDLVNMWITYAVVHPQRWMVLALVALYIHHYASNNGVQSSTQSDSDRPTRPTEASHTGISHRD